MITPNTETAEEWIEENALVESWQWLGRGFACEPRMAEALLMGAFEDGLTLDIDGREVVGFEENA
jgi:hypothetical protein